MFQPAKISDLQSFRWGNAQNTSTATGCSVFIAPAGASCGVAVRGGGPATRETDLLRPENMVEKVHAVVLAGGSAFGLAASSGVMEELAQKNIGFSLENTFIPLVVGACLFDLQIGQQDFPSAETGKEAVRRAFALCAPTLEEGNVGAGCGASVGKLFGAKRAMKAGLGVYGLRHDHLITVAVVAVNALGNVKDHTGSWIAGCRAENNTVIDPLLALASKESLLSTDTTSVCTNTTIGVVLTNACLTKSEATRVSSITHDAYARRIKPVHTSNDGDTIFTLASPEIKASPDLVAIMATEAMEGAIERSITQATGAYGLPSARDI